MSVFDKLVVIGPEDCAFVELKARSDGIYLLNESDGMRVLTSEKTYFFELVSEALVNTFKIASIEPSAKLHKAMKSNDYRQPQTEEIIRDLDKKIVEGIETLLSAAEGEQDVDVLKHLLATASFAKKFTTPTEFDPNRYVNLVKHSIVLTNMRYSDNFARAITFAELKVFKPKNVVRLLLKFRDYRLAIKVIELLNLKSLHLVYEDFCH